MQIQHLRLQCEELLGLQEFYVEHLGFPLIHASANGFIVQCGDSQLEFAAGEKAYYHFAFNIFPDQIASAAAWLEARGIALLPFEDERIVQFPNWEAEAVYFYDPAGNILEFIARKRLPASGNPDFSIAQVLSISEIGFGTYALEDVQRQLNSTMGLPIFGEAKPHFRALGDDHGLFILVDAATKLWIPMMEPAWPFPFAATLSSQGKSWDVKWDNVQLQLVSTGG